MNNQEQFQANLLSQYSVEFEEWYKASSWYVLTHPFQHSPSSGEYINRVYNNWIIGVIK